MKNTNYNDRTYVMGILNLTPDSFSGDGLMQGNNLVGAAIQQASQFVENGVDFLDLGAESSRPGSTPLDVESELERILPVLEGILDQEFDIPISIDTYKAKVAQECLEMGADMINDIWGLKRDPDLAGVISKYQAEVIIMHNRSKQDKVIKKEELGKSYVGSAYSKLIPDILADLQESIQIAKNAGIAEDKIIIDPGIGFGKNIEQNMAIINHLDEFKSMGYPILLGPSRKSFIGYTLDLPPAERLEGTAAAVAIGVVRGANIIRVHDVKEIKRLVLMCDAILKT